MSDPAATDGAVVGLPAGGWVIDTGRLEAAYGLLWPTSAAVRDALAREQS